MKSNSKLGRKIVVRKKQVDVFKQAVDEAVKKEMKAREYEGGSRAATNVFYHRNWEEPKSSRIRYDINYDTRARMWHAVITIIGNTLDEGYIYRYDISIPWEQLHDGNGRDRARLLINVIGKKSLSHLCIISDVTVVSGMVFRMVADFMDSKVGYTDEGGLQKYIRLSIAELLELPEGFVA